VDVVPRVLTGANNIGLDETAHLSTMATQVNADSSKIINFAK
jgi:hypothetical protein